MKVLSIHNMKFQSFFLTTCCIFATQSANRQHFSFPSNHPSLKQAPKTLGRRLIGNMDNSFPPPGGLINPGSRVEFENDETYLLCYYENWARYQRPWTQVDGEENSDVFEQSFNSKKVHGKYTLDPNVCTHIMYGFLYIDPETYEMDFSDPWSDLGYDHVAATYYGEKFWQKSGVYNALKFKKENKKLRLMGSVGGWNFNTCDMDCYNQGKKTAATFSEIAASESKTRKFARSAKAFLQRWHFDGLDLDWEYPAAEGRNDCVAMGQTPADKQNFITMIKRIKEEFRGTDLLVTAAVGVGLNTVDVAYDIPAMAEELDLISLMTYDMHGAWEHVLGFNAPLYATEQDTTHLCTLPDGTEGLCMGGNAKVSTEYAVEYWLAQGVPADKLAVGVPTYGRGFTMEDGNCHTPGVCAKDYNVAEKYPDDEHCPQDKMESVPAGASAPTEGTKGPGMISYYEVMTRIEQGWSQGRSEGHGKVPYIYDEQTRQWFGYDDTVSLAEKMKFIKSKQVRGAMVWALSLDDTRGDFSGEAYPLLNEIKRGLAYKVCTSEPCGDVVPVALPTAPPTRKPVRDTDCCPSVCKAAGCGAPLASRRCVSSHGYCGVSDVYCNEDQGGTDCTVCATHSRECYVDMPTEKPTNPPAPTPPPTSLNACTARIFAVAPCMPTTKGLKAKQRQQGAEVSLQCPSPHVGEVTFACNKGHWDVVDGACQLPECSELNSKQQCRLNSDCKWKQWKQISKKKKCYGKNFRPGQN